jgi:hypothetical protein
MQKSANGVKVKYENSLLEQLNKLEQSYLVAVKTASANLLMFTANEFTLMSADSGSRERKFISFLFVVETNSSSFGVDVHEKIVVGGLQDLCALVDDQSLWENAPEDLDLLYSIFLHQLTKKNLKYLMDLTQEQYKYVVIKWTMHFRCLESARKWQKVCLQGRQNSSNWLVRVRSRSLRFMSRKKVVFSTGYTFCV